MEEPLTSFSKQYRTSSGNDNTLIQPANPKRSIYDICNIVITANRYLLVKLWCSNGPFSGEYTDIWLTNLFIIPLDIIWQKFNFIPTLILLLVKSSFRYAPLHIAENKKKGQLGDGVAIAFTVGLFLDTSSGGSEHYA